jgi:hypothetical protein
VLQLGHVLFGGGLFRECPRQHEFGLEDRSCRLHHAVEGGRDPAQHRVLNLALNIGDDLAGIALEPAPIEVLGRRPDLDHQIVGEVFGFSLSRFSRQSRRRARSSSPMMTRASEPPMKARRLLFFSAESIGNAPFGLSRPSVNCRQRRLLRCLAES